MRDRSGFHFESFDNIYLSYETFYGCGLDNKKPCPKTKKFTNTHFHDAHTFEGVLDWSSLPENATVRGTVKWIYSFVIDKDWTTIKSGTLRLFQKFDYKPSEVYHFGQDLHYRIKGIKELNPEQTSTNTINILKCGNN